MKEYYLKYKEWWSGLATRERRLLGAGGCALILFLVYLCLWSPLMNQVIAMRKQIQVDRKTLAWMQNTDGAIQKIAGQAPVSSKSLSPVVLLSLLQKQINQAEIGGQLKELKQITNDSLEIHFQKVSFDKLIKVLATFSKTQGVTIIQMSTVGEATAGKVNADVTLQFA